MMSLATDSKCGTPENQLVKLDLFEVIQAIKAADSDPKQVSRSVMPTGFIYHIGRTGSTLVSNSLGVLDPTTTRVYSEPLAVLEALLSCDKSIVHCNAKKASVLVRDAITLMGRTSDPLESRVFYKLLPSSLLAIDIIRKAFPDTPSVFLYREPVQVLVSNLRNKNSTKAGPGPYCTQGMKNSFSAGQLSEQLVHKVSQAGRHPDSLSLEEFCAAYLVRVMARTICEMFGIRFLLSCILSDGITHLAIVLPTSLSYSTFTCFFREHYWIWQRTAVRQLLLMQTHLLS